MIFFIIFLLWLHSLIFHGCLRFSFMDPEASRVWLRYTPTLPIVRLSWMNALQTCDLSWKCVFRSFILIHVSCVFFLIREVTFFNVASGHDVIRWSHLSKIIKQWKSRNTLDFKKRLHGEYLDFPIRPAVLLLASLKLCRNENLHWIFFFFSNGCLFKHAGIQRI